MDFPSHPLVFRLDFLVKAWKKHTHNHWGSSSNMLKENHPTPDGFFSQSWWISFHVFLFSLELIYVVEAFNINVGGPLPVSKRLEMYNLFFPQILGSTFSVENPQLSRNPKANHFWDVWQNPVNNKINYRSLNWWFAGFLNHQQKIALKKKPLVLSFGFRTPSPMSTIRPMTHVKSRRCRDGGRAL